MGNELRAFIGLEICPKIRKKLEIIQKDLKSLKGDISWVKPENLHLSIRFLGNINQEELKKIERINIRVARQLSNFPISLGVLGTFPNISNPRVLWAGISSGYNQVTEINTLIAKELSSIDFKTGDRHFHPHITLARINSIQNKAKFSKLVDEIKPHSPNAEINKLTLYKSKLDSKGAIYTKIQEVKLGKD